MAFFPTHIAPNNFVATATNGFKLELGSDQYNVPQNALSML